MSKAEVPPFQKILGMAQIFFVFLLHLKHFQRAGFSETTKHFLPEESRIPSLRHLYRCIAKPLTTSENFVLPSAASPCPSVWALVVLLLQARRFALSSSGGGVSLGCPHSPCVQQAQKCSFTNGLTEPSKRVFSVNSVFLQQKTLSPVLITVLIKRGSDVPLPTCCDSELKSLLSAASRGVASHFSSSGRSFGSWVHSALLQNLQRVLFCVCPVLITIVLELNCLTSSMLATSIV